jgi:hypothetical protein
VGEEDEEELEFLVQIVGDTSRHFHLRNASRESVQWSFSSQRSAPHCSAPHCTARSSALMLYLSRVLAVVLALMVQGTTGFSLACSAPGREVTARTTVLRLSTNDKSSDDPIGNPFVKAINSLQEAVQNSPAAAFKKNLAKAQAGSYDEAATRAELNALIAEPAVMFSFTT